MENEKYRKIIASVLSNTERMGYLYHSTEKYFFHEKKFGVPPSGGFWPLSTAKIRLKAVPQTFSSRLVGFTLQVGVKQFLSGRLFASARRLDGDEDGVDLLKDAGIVELERPALLFQVVDVEEPQTSCCLIVCSLVAPGLKCVVCVQDALIVQLEGVKDQRFVLCVEDPSDGLPRPAFAIIVGNINDVQIAGSHDITDVPINGQ